MRSHSLFRDFALLVVAGALGWWAHSAATVHAAPPAPLPLSFQFGGTGAEPTLSLYEADSHQLFVYPTRGGSDTVGCLYSFYIKAPGGPLERRNCGPVPLTSH